MAITKTEELLEKLATGDFRVSLSIDLDRPTTSETDYNTAINMLDWEESDNITITEQEYKSYILDEWGFSRNFAISKLAYLAGK